MTQGFRNESDKMSRIWSLNGLYDAFTRYVDAKLQPISAALAALQATQGKIMAGITDINNAETTLHADLVAQNGLIKQLLTAFANQTLTPEQAQALVDQMNSDDADAKLNLAAIQAALPAVPPTT